MINTLIFCDDNHCNIANGQTVISIGADNMSGAIFVLSKKNGHAKYSRTSIIRTAVCHFNLKGIQIGE